MEENKPKPVLCCYRRGDVFDSAVNQLNLTSHHHLPNELYNLIQSLHEVEGLPHHWNKISGVVWKVEGAFFRKVKIELHDSCLELWELVK